METERIGAFERREVAPGVALWTGRTDLFKSVALRVTLREFLDEETSLRALVASLLKRGCRGSPDMLSLARRLEGLWGASLGLEVERHGEEHHTSLGLRTAHDRFLPGRPPALRESLRLLSDLLTAPVVEGEPGPDGRDEGFPAAVFEQERRNQLHAIGALADDKASWAHHRLLEEMYRGEPYARYEGGEAKATQRADRREALAFHRRRLRTAPIDVAAAGPLDDGDVAALETFAAGLSGDRAPVPPPPTTPGRPTSPRAVIEPSAASQSRLLLGFHVDLADLDRRADAALGVLTSLLGGAGAWSRLFRELRERRGLVYEAHAGIDRRKGFFLMSAGLDRRRSEEALEVMRHELAAVTRGEIGADELRRAADSLAGEVAGLADSPDARIEYALGRQGTARAPDPAGHAADLRAVTAAEVARAAGRLVEEVTFLLEGNEDDAPAPPAE